MADSSSSNLTTTWIPLLAGVALTLLVTLIVLLLRGDGAEQSATTTEETTVTTVVTTTLPPTTTTEPPPPCSDLPSGKVIFDGFEGSTCLVALPGAGTLSLGDSFSIITVTEGTETDPATFMALYPTAVDDTVTIEASVRWQAPPGDWTFGGIALFADDPSDAVVDHFFGVGIRPFAGELVLWERVGIEEDGASEALPPESAFLAGQWTTIKVVTSGGMVSIYVNGALAQQFDPPIEFTSGHVGVVLVGWPGQSMEVDGFSVTDD